MIEHILLPGVIGPPSELRSEHRQWLAEWLRDEERDRERGIVTSSRCVAGVMAETWLHGETRTDWLGVLRTFLTDGARPLAYSAEFGKTLHDFNMWKQSPVHAVYSRWWIESILDSGYPIAGEILSQLKQPTGLVYDPVVSDTQPKSRMRSELLMSLGMAGQIHSALGNGEALNSLVRAAVSAVEPTRYLSAEYFRFRTLRFAGKQNLMVGDPLAVAEHCLVPNGPGFADYNVNDKTDAVMGTRSRTYRDCSVFSPLSTLHAWYLSKELPRSSSSSVLSGLKRAKSALDGNPMGIPHLKMRDLVDIPFGEGATVFEVLAAAHVLELELD